MGKAKAKLTPAEKAQRRLHTIKHLKQYSALYAMMILPLLYFIIFKYVPMFGNILAFRRYRPGQGMFGTEWTLRYFERFLKDPAFWRAFRNTLVVSLENLVINFPLPIIFAILLNEVRNKHLKKVVQTISYMPRFISTVVVIAIMNEILSPSSGLLNNLLHNVFGMTPIYFMNEPGWFRPLYILSESWQYTGWTAIIYLAAITGISSDLYEAAEMDGATRLQQIFTYPNFFQAYGNTFIYTIGGTTIAMLMTIMFAYPLSKDNLMGHKVFMKIVVISMFFAGGMIPNYLLVSSLHLTGTRWAMLLPFCISQFNLIIMINSFKSLPHELEEAALIDGLGYWGILRRIIVPLSTAAIATVGLYYAVFFWNDWFNSLIYLNKEQYPVMLFLRNIVNGTAMVGDGAGSADKSSLGIAIKSAVIIVSTLPIIILYPFLQKYFVKGLTVGGVKG